MHNLKRVTLAVISLGLLTTILFVTHYSRNAVQLVWIPYVVLFWLTFKAAEKNTSHVANIAVLVTASIFCLFSALAYYETSYGTSHSSTEALIYLVSPIESLVLIPLIYYITKWLLGFLTPSEEITD